MARSRGPDTESYIWRAGTSILGTLEVPTGFTEETENYREGIVTRLHYPDGSTIMLQYGGMYRIPLFQDAEDVLDSSKVEEARTIRRGRYKGSSRCWGEIDHAPMQETHTSTTSFSALFPPNLGYAKVPRKRADEFFRAVESFHRPE